MSELTRVELLWLKKRIENWIRFGRIAEVHVIDQQRRIVSFAPGSIFAFVRWASNDFGTLVSRIDILRAVGPGERYSTVPCVRPGGESLLRLASWAKVEKVLQAIDAVEALGIDPADAAPEHWRHLIKRILALPGQSVCRSDLLISVDGIEMGAALEHDRHGRALPTWQGCRVIAEGEVFLMNWDEPQSLDSRYFGPVPVSAIVGRAEPVWTFEEE